MECQDTGFSDFCITVGSGKDFRWIFASRDAGFLQVARVSPEAYDDAPDLENLPPGSASALHARFQNERVVVHHSSSRCLSRLLRAALVRHIAASVIGLGVTVAGCSDSTGLGAEKGATVSVAVSSISGPDLTVDLQGNPQVRCQVHLTASTTGEGNASWMDGELLFYFGRDRSAPVDSVPLTKQEISDSWGSETLRLGASQQSTWDVWADFPFEAVLDFGYTTAGQTKHVRTRVLCSPPINASTPAPTISPITMTPSSGELSAGAPASVSFDIDAPAGLWQTSIHLTSPCLWDTTIRESLQFHATHHVDVPIPGSCQLGVPIAVTVDAVDAADGRASRTLTSSVVLADHERPTLRPLYFPPNGGTASSVPTGEYFGGDSIVMLSNAGDNHALAAVVWEVLPYGVRDSLLPGHFDSPATKVPLRPDWSGHIQLKLWARDQVGLVSDTVLTPADSLRIHPMVSRPTRTGTVAGASWDFAIDSRRGLLYLRQDNDHRIAVVSLASMQVQSTIPLDGMPTDLDLTPSGDSLFVLLYGRPAIEVIDLRPTTPTISEVPIALAPSANQPIAQLRSAANGKVYLTATVTSQPFSLLEFDPVTRSQRVRTEAGVSGSVNSGMATSLDRSVFAITSSAGGRCVQLFNVFSDSFSTCTPIASFFGPMSLDGTGRRLAIAQDVYDQSLQLLPKAMPPLFPGDAAPTTLLSMDGESLFVPHQKLGFVRFRTSDNMMLDRTPNPLVPTSVRMSPDGTMLVSLENDYHASTRISVIDLR